MGGPTLLVALRVRVVLAVAGVPLEVDRWFGDGWSWHGRSWGRGLRAGDHIRRVRTRSRREKHQLRATAMPAAVDTVPLVLAGRDAERAAIAALLHAARAGLGGSLVVRGVAGSGKSTLLADAISAASGMRVLRTAGVEAESPLAFGALQRLLRPLRSRLEVLPARQRAALGAALGEADADGDRFLAFLGTLSMLADAAEETPVLAVIDDAHWLDDDSAAALLFVARRLQADGVALLFAARDGGAHGFEVPELPTMVLCGVTGADAAQLLSDRAGGPVDPVVRDRLVAATAGNPLALGELAAALTGEQLAGRESLPTPLPLTGGVEQGFLDRVRGLSDPAQRYVLLAAADDTGRFTVVRDAAARLGVDDDACDEVERVGLLRVDGDSLVLYHPLVRSAVYGAATSAQRRTAHRMLADVLGGDLDRRAWHLAAAADRPDATVVAELDGVAERAAARGGHEAASAAWARAAELTVHGEARGRRMLAAASSAWQGAHPSRAAGLAAAAATHLTDPRQRARLLLLRGQIEWHTHSLDDGYDLIVQAARLVAGVDEAMARPLAMLAASLSAVGALLPAPGRSCRTGRRAFRRCTGHRPDRLGAAAGLRRHRPWGLGDRRCLFPPRFRSHRRRPDGRR